MNLSSLCELIVDCVNRTAPAAMGGKYYAVGTPAMRENRLDLTQAIPIDMDTYVRWTRKLAPKSGDLLISREAPVGLVVQVPGDVAIAAGQRTMILRPGSEVCSRYLYYALICPQTQAALTGRASGSTVGHLRVGEVGDFELPFEVPAMKEQQAIAEVLGALDDKIAANRKMEQVSMGLAHACYRRVISTSSKAVPLGEYLAFEYGKALPVSRRRPGRVKVVGSGGVTGEHDVALVDGPGIVVGRKGSVGSVHWVPRPHFPIDTTFRVVNNSEFPLEYWYFALNDMGFSDMNSDSAVPGLNRDAALRRLTAVPGSEIDRFKWMVPAMFAAIDGAQRESFVLARLRDALLPALMDGTLRVRDAVTRVEEAL